MGHIKYTSLLSQHLPLISLLGVQFITNVNSGFGTSGIIALTRKAQDTTAGDNQIEIRLYPTPLQPKLWQFLIFQPFPSVTSACLSLGFLLRQCYLL